jgi:hypothetical protein
MFSCFPKSNLQSTIITLIHTSKNSSQSLFSRFILSPATVALSLIFVLSWSSVWGQTTTITITNATIGGSGVLGSNSYNSGAERTWTQSSVNFGGKAITCNPSNAPTSASACQYIQAQANNGVIYNTSALPGRIVSIKFTGTASLASSCFGGTARLINTTSGNYTVNSGTQIGTAQTNTTYTWTTGVSDNYTFFCIKRGGTAQYFSSIEVTYENAPSPTISSTGTLSAVNTTYGTASASPTSFNVSGANMTAGILVTPPVGFEVSQSVGSGYGSTTTVGAAGTIASTPVYVRLAATSAVASYSGNIVLSSSGATSVNVATVSSSVSTKALTVTASAQTKTEGSTLPTTGTLNTHFTVSGLVNGNTANQTTLAYSGSPTGNLATATPGSYTITPSALTLSSGSISNYSITYNTGTLTVNAASTPTLNPVTLTSALSSTYGTASAGVSFTVNGSNLTAESITATAQTGYEVSTTLGTGYGASVSVAAGTTVYVRFTSTMSAGDKNNATAVVLSGGGASSNANVTTSLSGNTVSQKALTVTGLTAQNKVYDGLTTATTTGTAALSGVVGADVVSLTGTPIFTFSSSIVASGVSVSTSGYSLTGAQSANYSLTQPTLSANITVRSLTITANNVSKIQGVLLSGGAGSTAFSSSGLQNSETIGSVTITYGTAGATTGDGNTVGVYASQVTPSVATSGTFTASNYSISYVAGSITVTPAPCATEDFENMPASNSSSLSRTWTGNNGLTWTAEGARTDRTLNGRAISFGNSGNRWVTSPSYSGGLGILKFKYVRDFTGTGARSIQVFVNGIQQGSDITVSNSSDVVVQYESEINLIGNVILEIRSNGASQVKIDDISWTCYTAPEINIKQSSNLVSGSGSFSLGTVTTGSSSSATTFTIENTGTATLNITGTPIVAISGHTSDFAIDQTSTSATVSASGSTTFTVTYSPTTTGARSATISIANDDSNENPYTFTVTGTGATYAPSVTTSPATSINTTGATLNGEVTSDGGATVTERGFVYKTSSSVTISDNKTTVAGTTGTFSLSPSSLSASTQYYFRAFAINSVNTTLGSELNFWTLANAPTAPTVNTPTGSSLNVSIGGVDGNSATTAYAIQETTSGNYVQANGSLAASAVWQTSSAWSSITVIGLSSATTYTFQVKARNGANTETAFGSTTNGTTSSIGLNAVILSSELTSTYGSVSSGVSFTASGTNLTSNITVTAQSGYQVSTDNNSFEASVSIASGTTVYVRFTSTRLAGNYNNEIALVLSGGGAASNANVSTSLSGNTVSKATPTVTSAPTATAITYGQTLASSTLSGGTASVAGAFTFTSPSTAPNAGTANQSVTFTPTDNTNYNTTTANVSVSVNKANQTITFGALADKTTDDTPFALTATASSGITVSYSSSNTAVATVAGSTVTIVGAGQTTITASQAGDANYNAATSVDQTLTVTIPACITNSDQLGGWNFTTASPSTTISNLTIGDLTQGNNNGTTTLINATSASSGYSGATGTNNAGAAARTGVLNTDASGSAYFQFTLTPANGYNFTLTGINFGSRSTSTGPKAYALRSSLDSYSNDISSNSLTNSGTTNWGLNTITSLNVIGQGNANPVTFRLYGYNGAGSAGINSANWRIDDLILTVTVSNAPSSASVGSTQSLCGTLASAALGGNTPSLGTGTWTQTAGPGTTTFSNSSNGSSTATSSIEGAYTYKWSISNGCATVNEASVSVSFGSIPSAPTASAQSFCSSASPTIASLTATGSSIKWYDESINGNLVASETALSAGNYYASQTVSGCESTTRTSVEVTINSNGTWIGGELGEWNIANNWCGGVPNSNTAVVSIPAGVTIDLDASPSVLDLTVGSGSTLNLGGNTITIANGGAFTNNGTFNAQTGTVAFSGTGTLAGNATTFNNLTTNGNLNASASPTINGTLTLSSGTLSVGANTLTVNGSISTTSGNIDASNASATVVFGGSSAQTIPASTFTGNINNLTLSNSAGLTTNQSLTVANTLSLSSGVLTLGTNNLTLTGSLHATNNGSSTAFINTNNSGAFIRSISSTGVDYKFPVGLSDYAPITVNFTGGTIASSTLASRAVSGLHPDAVDGAYIRSNLYWQMNQSGMTNPQYNVSFTYPGVTNGVGSSETEANLLPAKYSASTGWLSSGSCAICYSGTTMGTSSINTETKTLTWNGVTGFSDFGGFGEGNGSPLPVELLSFNGICDENQIQLTWSTASENNSDYFEILKSQDGENWRAVNKQAAAGFSTTLQMYSFIETEKSNNAYYRLNQVDFNGDNKLYDPIFIDCEGNTSQLITYPNPSKNGFNIVISDSKLVGEATLIIRDAMGKEVLTKSISIAEGMNLFPIASYEIENGVYFITIEGENAQTKMIKHIKN